jgi:nicotinamidase/pyrazinamidase
LLVVDIQNDFCPGGALSIPEGDRIIPRLNAYVRLFREAGRPIIATRDWHPQSTTHFRSGGGLWPVHCVAGTPGAEFHPAFELPEGALVVSKGMGDREDAYSAFQARDGLGTLLPELLRDMGVEHIYVSGLALDYCVKFTALDAVRDGFGVTVLIDATRAVNVSVHDAELAIEEIVRVGAELAVFEQLVA